MLVSPLAAEVGTAMLVWKAHNTKVLSLAFSPDGTRIATTADKSGTVCLWHAPTGQLVTRFVAPRPWAIHAVAFFSDGRYIAGHLTRPRIRIWNVES